MRESESNLRQVQECLRQCKDKVCLFYFLQVHCIFSLCSQTKFVLSPVVLILEIEIENGAKKYMY